VREASIECNKIYLDAIIHKFKLMAKEMQKKNRTSKYIENKLLKMTIHDAVTRSLYIMKNSNTIRL
jgi:hypothetical protein